MHGLQSDGLLSCTGIHFPICQNGGYCRGNKDCFPGNKCSGSFVRSYVCMHACMHVCMYVCMHVYICMMIKYGFVQYSQ